MEAKIYQTDDGWIVEGEGGKFGPFSDMWVAISATPFFHYRIMK